MRRNLLTRWLVVAAVVTVGGFTAERAGWAAAAGADVWNLPALEKTLAEHQKEEAALDAACDTVAERIAAKEVLTGEVVAGRMTLDEASGHFERMNYGTTDAVAVLIGARPTAGPREVAAKNVVNYVTAYRYDSPAERVAVTGRVTGEFTRLFPESAHQ